MEQIIKKCNKHGDVNHYKRKRYNRPSCEYKCNKCNTEAVSKRRRLLKQIGITYLGGKCKDCNLVSEYQEVYDFHHLDPSNKDFNISSKGHTISEIRLKKELDKCVLLCSNCHRIRHALEYQAGTATDTIRLTDERSNY